MAIYHFSAQIISRAKGRCSVAAAAYRAGEKLNDERTGLSFDYTKKVGVEHTEILAPSNVPSWVNDREKLWNEVEKIEKRKDAQLSREINLALPRELDLDKQVQLTKEFVKDNFVSKGMVADVYIHNTKNDNPHAHIMLTTREINENGFDKKNRDWNDKELLETWREEWAKYANRALEREGINFKIDHRTLEEQGIDRIPQIHVGAHANAMENKGLETERGSLNKEIRNFNHIKVIELEKYKKEKEVLEQQSNFTLEEKKVIEKAEKIIGKDFDRYAAESFIQSVDRNRREKAAQYQDFDINEKQLKTKLNNIEFAVKSKERLESELNQLPRGLFGGYKDKNRAEAINNSIKNYEELLNKEDYINEERYKTELQLTIKDKNIVRNKISELEYKAKVVSDGVEVLKSKENRDYKNNLKKEFKYAEYLKPHEVDGIKSLNMSVGKIKDKYFDCMKQLKVINQDIKAVHDLEYKVNNAKRNIDVIEQYQDITDKWNKKLFGRDKFQNEHRKEYQQYQLASQYLETLGINDKKELIEKEQILNSFDKEKLYEEREKLQKEVDKIKPSFKAIMAAEEREEIQKQKEILKEQTKQKDEKELRAEFRRYREFER